MYENIAIVYTNHQYKYLNNEDIFSTRPMTYLFFQINTTV